MGKTHYYTDENGVEHCLAPVPGCECMQCHYERDLDERGKTGENWIGGSNAPGLFGVEESKQRRKEQRRGDAWLERHGFL